LGGESGGGDRRCRTCRWWRPHFHYPIVGYCTLWGKLTTDDDGCDRWEPIKIEEGKFYWCLSCRRRVSWEEAKMYLKEGEILYESAYMDPDVREEIVGAAE